MKIITVCHNKSSTDMQTASGSVLLFHTNARNNANACVHATRFWSGVFGLMKSLAFFFLGKATLFWPGVSGIIKCLAFLLPFSQRLTHQY